MNTYYKLIDTIILNDNFRKFLKMKSNEIKFNFILNYLLCNYFDDIYINNDVIFKIRSNFKKFLINNQLYNTDIYSIEDVKKLLENFISKKKIIITI
jgi:hypothetical protein